MDTSMKTFKIYLPRLVHGDWPIGHNTIAQAGIHDAVANKYGAVSVVLPDGKLLGVKPGEFERVQCEESKPIRLSETSDSYVKGCSTPFWS